MAELDIHKHLFIKDTINYIMAKSLGYSPPKNTKMVCDNMYKHNVVIVKIQGDPRCYIFQSKPYRLEYSMMYTLRYVQFGRLYDVTDKDTPYMSIITGRWL